MTFKNVYFTQLQIVLHRKKTTSAVRRGPSPGGRRKLPQSFLLLSFTSLSTSLPTALLRTLVLPYSLSTPLPTLLPTVGLLSVVFLLVVFLVLHCVIHPNSAKVIYRIPLTREVGCQPPESTACCLLLLVGNRAKWNHWDTAPFASQNGGSDSSTNSSMSLSHSDLGSTKKMAAL